MQPLVWLTYLHFFNAYHIHFQAPTSEVELPVVSDYEDDKCDNNDDDSGAVAGAKILAHVNLSKVVCE